MDRRKTVVGKQILFALNEDQTRYLRDYMSVNTLEEDHDFFDSCEYSEVEVDRAMGFMGWLRVKLGGNDV